MKPKILISTGGGDASNYIAAIESAGGEADARYLPAPGRPRAAGVRPPLAAPALSRPEAGPRGRSLVETPMTSLGYDGLLLAGGADIDPALFGEENQGSQGIDPARDAAEFALLDAFFGAGKPVLAICRGHQVVNVWLGGGLIQDLPPDLAPTHCGGEGDRVHPIKAAEGSLLHRMYGPAFAVNSTHHQALGRLGRGLSITARSPDGVVEAVEHDTLPLISVQFHPERMTGAKARPDTVDGGTIFKAFLAMTGKT